MSNCFQPCAETIQCLLAAFVFWLREHLRTDRSSNPVGIGCQTDVVLTSMRRNYVASTLIRRHFYVMCLLGKNPLRKSDTPNSLTGSKLGWEGLGWGRESKSCAHTCLLKKLNVCILLFIQRLTCQLMAVGLTGASGRNVQQLVDQARKTGREHVRIPLH